MSDKKDIPTAEIKADEPILAKKEYAKTERSKSEQGAEKMNTSSNGTPKTDALKTETVVVKKGGAGLALLALLIALGVGAGGYYFGQQEVEKINQKLTALESQIGKTAAESASNTLPNIAQDNEQLTKLVNGLKTTDEKLAVLERSLSDKETALSALQTQVTNVASNMNAQPSEWLLSEADFLLNNALRKLLLDNDVETSIALLKISDEVLAKVSEPEAKTVRAAINTDLKQLLSVDSVDQNAVMQRLSQLANSVDELVAMNVNFGDDGSQAQDEQVSDDVTDWKNNLQRTATSFLNHFIRISPRTDKMTQALLAPNQDIYLRENIRLRLQIAILAVPRQQNELYKQSLETVAAWVRSYFDTETEVAKNFLKSVDELAEQSIYVDVPNQLSSLNALDKLLNKKPQEVQKIEISADKGLTEANQAAAKEIKGEEKAADAKSGTEKDTAPKAEDAKAEDSKPKADNAEDKPAENP
ncbi:uroporphyrinogen-III C-methyltransferase [Exercitatus varius]|uniref:uroporphyrinogen-III C-methyltransferase n=1 Tax=Exercitatus varius TaxID=67857 RepID=UPI00374F4D8E